MDQNSNKPSLPVDMPVPTGWQLLLTPYEPEKVTKGGIILTDKQVEHDKLSSQVAYVAAVGDSAYQDARRFPNGPWCKEGDWIIISKWGGRRFNYHGTAFRMINDDEVLGVVKDPEAVFQTAEAPTWED